MHSHPQGICIHDALQIIKPMHKNHRDIVLRYHYTVFISVFLNLVFMICIGSWVPDQIILDTLITITGIQDLIPSNLQSQCLFITAFCCHYWYCPVCVKLCRQKSGLRWKTHDKKHWIVDNIFSNVCLYLVILILDSRPWQ